MKKTLALLLALTFALALIGCGTSAPAADKPAADAPAVEAPAAEVKTYKVGLAIYDYNDTFMTNYRNEIMDYFKTLETDTVKYEVTMTDGKNDMGEQSAQIDTFITQGMDAIILNLVQTSSADVLIDKIVAADIPCILINREPLGDNGDMSYPGIVDNAAVCYIGCDARDSGTYEGQMIVDTPNSGDVNGDGVVKYIMLWGQIENPDAKYRTEYSVKALTDAGIKVEMLNEYYCEWNRTKGQEATQQALAQFADDIEVVFANNDDMAIGAAQAISDAGRSVGEDIYLVGVDALPEAMEMVKEGTMTGTVLNDHIGQSHTAVDVTISAMNGDAIENYYWVPYVMVNQAYFG